MSTRSGVRWELVAGATITAALLLLTTKRRKRKEALANEPGDASETVPAETSVGSQHEDLPTPSSAESPETSETAASPSAPDATAGTDVQRLPMIEMMLIAFLVTLLVRGGALLGHTSEEQVKSGILPAEQVVWNFQKVLRCILVVLCFTSSTLQKPMANPVGGKAGASRWPNMVFSRLSQELWLLPSTESEQVTQRRRLSLFLVAGSRALLGTVRSFIKFRAHMDEKVEQNICSAPLINWIIFLLDVTANCGFLLGFSAGRHYFAATVATVAAPEQAQEPSSIQPLQRPRAVPVPSTATDAEIDEIAMTSPRSSQLPAKDNSLKAFCQGEQVEHPIFTCYARRGLLLLLLTSALECCFLSHWEAGILGNRDDEVDIFRMRPYFQSWTPDFSRWRLRRLILGSWRDLFYLPLLYPIPAVTFAACAWLAHRCQRWMGAAHAVLQGALRGLMSYAVLLAAHRAYFAMSCLLICWECRHLEARANDFALHFPSLSPRQRWLQHVALTGEVKALQLRLAPLIRYVFLQRLAYLALDVARQSCDALLPFNLVHYLFRHVMFLTALGITAWRIGKLNFSIYEKLHNVVMDLLPRNWAEPLGKNPTLQQEILLQRWFSEDWFRYLQHNIDTGRRDACICVFHLRFAAKTHVLALSVLTLLTLPLLNKVLEYYGRHVVNDRLLGPENVVAAAHFVGQMERTCVAPGE